MTNIQAICAQIKTNCNISDAKYWGTYSLCGLLLRLRELYRAEMGLMPWERLLQKDVGEWINEREALWREIEGRNLENISVNGDEYGPFEVERINSVLNAEGLLYGAGFGLYMKPVFFATDIISHRKVDGFDVYIAGSEHARELSDYPAMLQNNTIIARVDITRLLLWNRFEEFRVKKTKCKLSFAFSEYGIPQRAEPDDDLHEKISGIALSEAETYVYHELGEAYEGRRLGDRWKTFLTNLPHSQSEVFARAVKDILSDTAEKGMLPYIIERRNGGSLGFYNVFLSGFRKIIFPEMVAAFQAFSENGDWGEIERARTSGYRNAADYADRLLSIYEKNLSQPGVVAREIEEEIMKKIA
ncbi:MAG TPA: hypothetical protein VK435_01460 [Thermodesulfovibrionales bacterium]|nr:hypothetical protein [Thermodesulfovibrionales bacterium]